MSANDIGYAVRELDKALSVLGKAGGGLTDDERLVLGLRREALLAVRHGLVRDRAAIRARLREVTT